MFRQVHIGVRTSGSNTPFDVFIRRTSSLLRWTGILFWYRLYLSIGNRGFEGDVFLIRMLRYLVIGTNMNMNIMSPYVPSALRQPPYLRLLDASSPADPTLSTAPG